MEKYEDNFYKLMGELEKVFPVNSLAAGADKVYWKYLKDIITNPKRKGDLERGIKKIIQTRLFPTFPTIAEIRSASKPSWAEGKERREGSK